MRRSISSGYLSRPASHAQAPQCPAPLAGHVSARILRLLARPPFLAQPVSDPDPGRTGQAAQRQHPASLDRRAQGHRCAARGGMPGLQPRYLVVCRFPVFGALGTPALGAALEHQQHGRGAAARRQPVPASPPRHHPAVQPGARWHGPGYPAGLPPGRGHHRFH
ncbi:hypothetical protein D3C71_1726520 [compost metagenome]